MCYSISYLITFVIKVDNFLIGRVSLFLWRQQQQQQQSVIAMATSRRRITPPPVPATMIMGNSSLESVGEKIMRIAHSGLYGWTDRQTNRETDR